MTRLAYDMTVRRGGCQLTTMLPVDGPFGSVTSYCPTPTRGLTVYVPISPDGVTTLRVSVCPRHLHDLWERFGLPRGEPVWQHDPTAHEADAWIDE
jgi:hypothetical protein